MRSENVLLFQLNSLDSTDPPMPKKTCMSVGLHGAPSMSTVLASEETNPPLVLRRNRRYWSGRLIPSSLSHFSIRSSVSGGPDSSIVIIMGSLLVKNRRCAQCFREAV